MEGCGSSLSESAIPTASNTEDFASPISERVAQVAAFKTRVSTKNETLTSLIISMQLTSTHSSGHSADVVSFVIEADQLGGEIFWTKFQSLRINVSPRAPLLQAPSPIRAVRALQFGPAKKGSEGGSEFTAEGLVYGQAELDPSHHHKIPTNTWKRRSP